VAGAVLAGLSLLALRTGAARRQGAAREELFSAVRGVAQERVAEPVRTVLAKHRATRLALAGEGVQPVPVEESQELDDEVAGDAEDAVQGDGGSEGTAAVAAEDASADVESAEVPVTQAPVAENPVDEVAVAEGPGAEEGPVADVPAGEAQAAETEPEATEAVVPEQPTGAEKPTSIDLRDGSRTRGAHSTASEPDDSPEAAQAAKDAGAGPESGSHALTV
jgi:hypothetical protein